MPLIINEMITTVEKPEGDDEPLLQASGVQESEAKLVASLELNREREARLTID